MESTPNEGQASDEVEDRVAKAMRILITDLAAPAPSADAATPAERARDLAEQLARDAAEAARTTRFTRYTG